MLERLRAWLDPVHQLPEEYELRIQRLQQQGAVIACIYDGAGACMVCHCHRFSWSAARGAARLARQLTQEQETRVLETLQYFETFLP